MSNLGIKALKIRHVLILIPLMWIASIIAYPDSNKVNYIFRYDISEYYVYVPDWFIYDGRDFDFIYELDDKTISERLTLHRMDDGQLVSKMTMGMAIMYSPCFLLGHIFAFFEGTPLNGYTSTYAIFITFTGLIFGWLGLLVLSRSLALFFKEWVTALVLVILGLGTNLLYYATTEGAMSHASSFFLMSMAIWLTLQENKCSTLWRSLILGLVLGLIVLVRPVNVFFLLFPVLYGIRDTDNFFRRMQQDIRPFIAMTLGILLMISLQLFHWKIRTGDYLFYGYQEGFDFLHPHLWECLFGFRKGWLIYTPIMIFSIIGLFFRSNKLKNFYPAIWVLPVLMFYILSSWDNWWYGGSFGFRPMIEWYAFLAFPMALFIERLKGVVLIASLLLAGLLVALNIFQTHQYNYRVMHWDSMTWPAYKKIFLKRKKPADLEQYLETPQMD